jgi:integrase
MGTISKWVAKNGEVTFQAKCRRKGFRSKTKSFTERKDASAWIRATESAWDRGEVGEPKRTAANGLHTVADVLRRYAAKVSPKKNGGDIEIQTINRWLRECKEFIALEAARLSSADVAKWRDLQLEGRAGSSVARQMNILFAAINLARAEWDCEIPTIKVARPKSPPHRDRILKPDEEKKLLAAAGKDANKYLLPIIVFALETAMRAGEIINARWTDIDWERRVIHVPRTKTGQPRDVPMSARVIDTIKALDQTTDRVFDGLNSETLKRRFIKVVKVCEIKNFHFHDCRHTCLSRLAREKGWNPLHLSTLSGHKDIRMLQRYVHLKADDLVAML